ncbi:MAG: ABC transporter permease [Methylohalobius sp.]|nr:ABC transporter permease [Methylohalobius sp.]
MQRWLPAASLLGLLIIWQILAWKLQSPLLPSPLAVFDIASQHVRSGELPHHLAITLIRLGVSFSLAMILGCALGVAMGLNPLLDRALDPWLTVFLNIPALVTVILCYVWLGLTETAAILAVVVNKLPNVVVTLREGTKALDKGLLEMAHVYRFGRAKTLRHVVWPQLYPFVIAAARTGLALVWKIILVVELLGRSDGVGYQLHLFFQLFDVAGILAYTLAFTALIQLLEWGVLKPLDRHASRWRR